MQRWPAQRRRGGDDGGAGQLEVGVGDDEEVVLGPAEYRARLPAAALRGYDGLGDAGAADEADGLDVGVVGDRLDRGLAAVDGVEHARGQTRPLAAARRASSRRRGRPRTA